MAKTKKMTLKYWNTLDEGSRRRALTCVFPLNKFAVDLMLDEKPDPKKSELWRLVWLKVRIPIGGYSKTVVNNTYLR